MGKEFQLKDEEFQVIKNVMDQEGLNQTKALCYILNEYQKYQNIENIFRKVLKEQEQEHKNFTERIRWATRVAEQNSIVLLDAVNTILVNNNVEDLIPVDTYESPVITKSKNIMKQKIAHFKQQKDYRERNKRKNP